MKKKAYYLVLHHSGRGMVDASKRHFKSLALRLLGDKDHEKIVDISAKVAKQFRKEHDEEERDFSQYDNRGKRSTETLRGFFCNEIGQVSVDRPLFHTLFGKIQW